MMLSISSELHKSLIKKDNMKEILCENFVHTKTKHMIHQIFQHTSLKKCLIAVKKKRLWMFSPSMLGSNFYVALFVVVMVAVVELIGRLRPEITKREVQ